MVADNDLALGMVVEGLSKSRSGKKWPFSSSRTTLRTAQT